MWLTSEIYGTVDTPPIAIRIGNMLMMTDELMFGELCFRNMTMNGLTCNTPIRIH